MTMQSGTKLKKGCIIATSRLYTHKIDLEFVVVLIYVVNVAGFMVIFIGLRG